MLQRVGSTILILAVLGCAGVAEAEARHALVVGIGDYSAEGLKPPRKGAGPVPGRSVPSLRGPGNDARAMRDVLVDVYGFAPRRVHLLLDRDATRAAILAAIEERLVKAAKPGDLVVFFFAGHGSQRFNSKSPEVDRRDETLVPADAALGWPDIRDKELRAALSRVLDRGARLTVILDSCHSGSGTRTPATPPIRGIEHDPRDVADPALGEPLETRGAVVLSASQDFQPAYETHDGRGTWYGAFTHALLRAVRRARPGESAEDLFARARAFLQGADGFSQEPVLAGPEGLLRASPFGGTGRRDRGTRAVAVERREGDGVILQGGWLHGLAVGSELESLDRSRNGAAPVHLRVTELVGRTRSRAEVLLPRATGKTTASSPMPRTGDLFAVSGWAMLPVEPMEVWVPVSGDAERRWAARLIEAAEAAGVATSDDATEGCPPSHVLRWIGDGWALEWGAGESRRFTGGEARDPVAEVKAVLATVSQHPGPHRLAVELPVPAVVGAALDLAPEGGPGKVVRSASPAALYRLAARRGRPRSAQAAARGGSESGLELAWLQRGVTSADALTAELPLRSRWVWLSAEDVDGDTSAHTLGPPRRGDGDGPGDLPRDTSADDPRLEPSRLTVAALGLSEDVGGLAHVRGWRTLAVEAPRDTFPYRLELRLQPQGTPPEERPEGTVFEEGQRLSLHLVGDSEALSRSFPRMYVYVVLVDSSGRCQVMFPDSRLGNVENHLPAGLGPAPLQIPLDESRPVRVKAPFGRDNYYLLATVEAIPQPWVLECPAVRSGLVTPLGSWLAELSSPSRGGATEAVTEEWFLQRVSVIAVPATGP